MTVHQDLIAASTHKGADGHYHETYVDRVPIGDPAHGIAPGYWYATHCTTCGTMKGWGPKMVEAVTDMRNHGR